MAKKGERKVERRYFVGLDLGQRQDFTALAVLERVETKGEWDTWRMAYKKDVACDCGT